MINTDQLSINNNGSQEAGVAAKPTLMVIVGPTGIGKTDLSIALARHFKTEILSCDSRQFYSEMNIGTAPPSEEQLASVPHHFIKTRSVYDEYTAGKYELDALEVLGKLFQSHSQVCMVGGSGLYIDAVCRGIDNIPATEESLRQSLTKRLEEEGIESLRFQLRLLDPAICDTIDIKNPQRVMRALEVCLGTGKRYSDLRTNFTKTRDFNCVKIGLTIPRDELYERINKRVDLMVEAGLEEEARGLYPHRHCNALKTVGYREWFDYFEGKTDRDKAIELIKRNTRHYAKRQLSWFARYDDITWFHPSELDRMIKLITP